MSSSFSRKITLTGGRLSGRVETVNTVSHLSKLLRIWSCRLLLASLIVATLAVVLETISRMTGTLHPYRDPIIVPAVLGAEETYVIEMPERKCGY